MNILIIRDIPLNIEKWTDIRFYGFYYSIYTTA